MELSNSLKKYSSYFITAIFLMSTIPSESLGKKKMPHPEGLTKPEQAQLLKIVDRLKTKTTLQSLLNSALSTKNQKERKFLKEFYESKIGKENPKIQYDFAPTTNTLTVKINNRVQTIQVISSYSNKYKINGYEVTFNKSDSIEKQMNYFSRVLKHQASGKSASLLWSLIVQDAFASDYLPYDLAGMWAIVNEFETPGSELCQLEEEGLVFKEPTVGVKTSVVGSSSFFSASAIQSADTVWKTHFAEFYCKNPDTQVELSCHDSNASQSTLLIKRQGAYGEGNTYTFDQLKSDSKLAESYASLIEAANLCCTKILSRGGEGRHLTSCDSEFNGMSPMDDDLAKAIKTQSYKSRDEQRKAVEGKSSGGIK